ncbi:MAG: aminopeptidase [Bdellovibrionales bacterium]|nr:aminopeptidase [Bdellovibrionales bacterium]
MRILLIGLILLLLSGCARISWLTEQGMGQAKILWRAEKNEVILDNPKISPSIKRKILLVEEYKKFFYHYFGQRATGIYTKTTMLDNKAVSYLVVASPHTKIEAHEFVFPIFGSFPYIGFFDLDSAKDFAEDLRKDENLVTWIRPVYAYSTLGYLEDRILSSFFEYDDVELAELVFHELFHTIFFIKNEVDLNENLANLYGKELLKEYFQDRDELKHYIATQEKKSVIDLRVVELISILQGEFTKLGGFITAEKADEMTERFVTEVFKPDLRNMCVKLKLEESDCELKDNWNQASFAAFLTYEEEQDFLSDLKKAKNLNLKDFLAWLKVEFKSFEDQKKIESFTNYLKLKVSHAPLAAD